jgi:hypothetical protein
MLGLKAGQLFSPLIDLQPHNAKRSSSISAQLKKGRPFTEAPQSPLPSGISEFTPQCPSLWVTLSRESDQDLPVGRSVRLEPRLLPHLSDRQNRKSTTTRTQARRVRKPRAEATGIAALQGEGRRIQSMIVTSQNTGEKRGERTGETIEEMRGETTDGETGTRKHDMRRQSRDGENGPRRKGTPQEATDMTKTQTAIIRKGVARATSAMLTPSDTSTQAHRTSPGMPATVGPRKGIGEIPVEMNAGTTMCPDSLTRGTLPSKLPKPQDTCP